MRIYNHIHIYIMANNSEISWDISPGTLLDSYLSSGSVGANGRLGYPYSLETWGAKELLGVSPPSRGITMENHIFSWENSLLRLGHFQ